jgi:hypothetical protein
MSIGPLTETLASTYGPGEHERTFKASGAKLNVALVSAGTSAPFAETEREVDDALERILRHQIRAQNNAFRHGGSVEDDKLRRVHQETRAFSGQWELIKTLQPLTSPSDRSDLGLLLSPVLDSDKKLTEQGFQTMQELYADRLGTDLPSDCLLPDGKLLSVYQYATNSSTRPG